MWKFIRRTVSPNAVFRKRGVMTARGNSQSVDLQDGLTSFR